MSTQDSKKPDPIGDMVESDIDKLLEQAGKLAQDAGRELGLSHEKQAGAAEGVPAKPHASPAQPPKAPGPGASSGEDVDAQLNELEEMLQKATESAAIDGASAQTTVPTPIPPDAKSVSASAEPSKKLAKPSQPQPAAPETKGQVSHESAVPQAPQVHPPEFDEFNVSVDLSDGEKEAEKEISERLAVPTEAKNAEPAVAVLPSHEGILGRTVAASMRAIEGVLTVLDLPFSGLPVGLKEVLGYIAIATLVMAIAAYVYGEIALGL